MSPGAWSSPLSPASRTSRGPMPSGDLSGGGGGEGGGGEGGVSCETSVYHVLSSWYRMNITLWITVEPLNGDKRDIIFRSQTTYFLESCNKGHLGNHDVLIRPQKCIHLGFHCISLKDK